MSEPKYDEDFKKSIVALHQSGKSQSQLSSEYDISLSVVSKLLKQYSDVKIDDNSIISVQQIKELQKRNALSAWGREFNIKKLLPYSFHTLRKIKCHSYP